MMPCEALKLLKESGYAVIESITEWSCPSCGANAFIYEIAVGSYYPVVGICFDAGHVWKIERGTHVGKEWDKKLKWRAESK